MSNRFRTPIEAEHTQTQTKKFSGKGGRGKKAAKKRRQPLSQTRIRRKKYTHYNVHMAPEDFKYLNPKEAQLQKCKQRMNFFNISIQGVRHPEGL